MQLNSLKNSPFSKKMRKRVGRGIGGGLGKTCGRGHKGQKSRSGVSIRTEGGQTPFIKRLPKRGFKSVSKSYSTITTDYIVNLVSSGALDNEAVVDLDYLKKLRIISKDSYGVKLIKGKKVLESKVRVSLNSYSNAAKDLILKSGGELVQV